MRAPTAIGGLHAPPHGMAARQAGGGRRLPAQRADEPLPRGERRVAFERAVLVLEQEERHALQAAASKRPDHQGRSLNHPPNLSLAGSARRRMLATTSVAARTDPIVGRRSELEQLDAALAALEAGSPACLAVEGEAGIGKTRLLAELRRRAEDRGHLVLSGTAAEFERDLPYGVWVEALDAYVASQEFAERAGGESDFMFDAAGILPSLQARNGSTATPLGDERHRTHRAMRQLLALIAERDPLVLVLDDLHWSDAASVELIAAFVRRGTTARVLLALGYRTGRAPAGLSSALAAPAATVLELGSLSEAECRSLAGGGLAAPQHTAIFRESGGNPFYALQLARTAQFPARSSSGDRMAIEAGVPRMVAAALVEELDALSPPARMLLDAGSIAGDPFEPELAYEIVELSTDAGTAALDELLETRLLHPTAVPRRFAFRHPLVRRAVYESTGGGWRLAAHARAASGLAARGASAASRAHHVEQSAIQGDAAAIELLLEAGAATAPRAPAAAARWFGAAAASPAGSGRGGSPADADQPRAGAALDR